MALNMSLKCTAVKNSHFKNPRWRTAAILTKNATSHNDEERVSQTYRPSAILDFDFLTARALEMFCIIVPNFVEIGIVLQIYHNFLAFF